MHITTSSTVLRALSGKSDYVFRVAAGVNATIVLVAADAHSFESSVEVVLAGRGAHATILGVFVGRGNQQLSLHTLQKHEAPETTSNLLVKAALRDNATFLYDGYIRVEKDAQKTDAYQRNENLFLSPGAKAVSSPGLEILANDVRCTHGATAGPIDREQLWYLASRGVGKSLAETLIAQGFLEAVAEKISDVRVKKKVHQLVEQV